MNYQDKILPWAVFDCRPKTHICVKKFRSKNDAENYAKLLRLADKRGIFIAAFCGQIKNPNLV